MLKILEPFIMLSLMIALGVFLYKVKLLDLDFARRLSSLVVRVTFPAMLFISMYKNLDELAWQQGWIFTLLGLGRSYLLAFYNAPWGALCCSSFNDGYAAVSDNCFSSS